MKAHVILDHETFFECDCKSYEFKKTCRHIETVKKIVLLPISNLVV